MDFISCADRDGFSKSIHIYIVIKTFCGIILCCLDASVITTRNDNELHDFSKIMKYTHFSILLLLPYSRLLTQGANFRFFREAKQSREN